MTTDRQRGKLQIEKLVTAFSEGIGDFKHSSYDEAKVRSGFVDPFFEALGWPVEDSSRRIAGKRQVVLEDRDGTGKRPDYGFYSGKSLKFFVEVKKPAVPISTDLDAIFQAKSYAWNKKVPLVLLTDFEELKGFFGGIRPLRDKPNAGVLPPLDLKFDRYVESFDFLWDTLSREAVEAGSIERFLLGHFKKRSGSIFTARGAVPVDAAFLEDLAGWRELLARELALRNEFSSDQALTECVQRILDRLVFIRVCEARGVTRGEPMLRAFEAWKQSGGSLYERLVSIFQSLMPQFNGNLFASHFSEGQKIEQDDVLEQILKGLYVQTPYRFDALPVEILGSIYERFLGSTIRLTQSGRAKVEEKPEVRHAGGVYYTPRFIVDAITAETLTPLTQGKAPHELLKLRVLDPACGSGSFLLSAFQHLVDAHLAHYKGLPLNKLPKEEAFLFDGEVRLTLKQRKKILTSSIFGLDKDPQAIEVAQMSLYLKLLEGEDEQSLARRETYEMFRADKYLPSLSKNLLCGNSLIESQDLGLPGLLDTGAEQDEALLQIRPFDWGSTATGFGDILKEGGFDAVVGNPPYIRIQEIQKWSPKEVAVFKKKFRSASRGNFDIYVLFVEQSLAKLKPRGSIGFILPHKFFQANYGEQLRNLLAERKAVSQIVDFGDAQIFDGATTYTCLLFLSGAPRETFALRSVREQADLSGALERTLEKGTEPVPSSLLARKTWDFRTGGGWLNTLRERLSGLPTLGSLAPAIFQAPVTGADYVFLLYGPRGKGRQWSLESSQLERTVIIEKDLLVPVLQGARDVKRWDYQEPQAWLIHPYVLNPGEKPRLLTERELRAFPATHDYLSKCRSRLESRKSGDFKGAGKWYAYARPQNLERFAGPKFMMPYMVNQTAVYHDAQGGYYFLNVTTGGYGFTLPTVQCSPYFILALIQSELLDTLVRQGGSNFRGGYFPCNKQFIENLPLFVPDLRHSGQKAEHDKLVALAEQAIQARQRAARLTSEHEKTLFERRLAAIQEEIDDRVYSLYQVTLAERQAIAQALAESEQKEAPETAET
ncbi:Eco57I restriction-modification methylase domain-containing protein [Myxococcus fulvus]|uniref:Eco57I restriction-modification methylase domain-containing protein n=1 Tax=Myxococcus TaxID=32 RepID=UPI00200B3D37|nr:N-6 DNA methylase [Myxococcus fulvus]MCK8496589.1 Eco57I restriction-modification methylase domain-containing protein [Myxococcus fulvus]